VTLLSLSSAHDSFRIACSKLIDRGRPRCVRPLQTQPSDNEFPLRLSFSLNPRRPPSQVFSFRQHGGKQRCAPKVWLRRTFLNYTIFSKRTMRQVRSSSNHTCVSIPTSRKMRLVLREQSQPTEVSKSQRVRVFRTPLCLSRYSTRLRVGINGGRRYSQSRRSGSHWSPYTVTVLLSTIKCAPFVIRNKAI
jgi:hypothetical protein